MHFVIIARHFGSFKESHKIKVYNKCIGRCEKDRIVVVIKAKIQIAIDTQPFNFCNLIMPSYSAPCYVFVIANNIFDRPLHVYILVEEKYAPINWHKCIKIWRVNQSKWDAIPILDATTHITYRTESWNFLIFMRTCWFLIIGQVVNWWKGVEAQIKFHVRLAVVAFGKQGVSYK